MIRQLATLLVQLEALNTLYKTKLDIPEGYYVLSRKNVPRKLDINL